MMQPEQISKVYTNLINVKLKFFDATESAIKARYELEIEKLRRLKNGEIFGKNEDERKASAHEVLWSQYEITEEAEQEEREARFNLDIAQTEVEMTRMLLRAEELIAQTIFGD